MKKLIALVLFAGALVVNSFANYSYLNTTNRSFNSVFQVDNVGGNDMVDLSYSITISASLTISGGQTGTVYLEQSPDGTNSWTEVARISNTSTGSVVIGVAMTDSKTMLLRGIVWPNYYVRLRTASTGTPSYTMIIGQEMGFN